MAIGMETRMTSGNESLCLASCEEEELFGAEGLCVESDGTCVCPSGSDGLDLLSFSEDCHVSAAVRVFILSTVLVLSLTATAVAVVGMVVTSKNKGGVFMMWRSWSSLSSRVCKKLRPAREPPSDGEESGLETSLRRFSRLSISHSLSSSANRPPPPVKRDRNGFPLPSTTVNSTTAVLETSVLPSVPASELFVTVDQPMPLTYRRQSKTIKEATMRQFGLMVLFALYGVTQTVFAVSGLFLNEFRHDENNLEFIAFALSITLIMGSIWQIPNILSRGLPSLKIYGSLFGINDLISKYTDVVKWTNQLLATFSAALTFVLSYVLPLLMGPENRRLYDKVLFISCGVLTLAWLLHTAIVSMLLLNVYTKGLKAIKSRLGDLPTNILALTRGLARARSIIRFNLLGSVVFALAVSSLMFALALSDLVYRNSYVFLGLGFSISCLVAIGYSILLLIFTRVVW